MEKALNKGFHYDCIKMGKLCSKKKKKKSALNSAPIEFMEECMDLMCANDDLFMDELGVQLIWMTSTILIQIIEGLKV